MADRYWVGGSANWSGTSDGSLWATSTGGTGGASRPTSTDNVFFDGNSGSVTVGTENGPLTCANLNFTGFTGTFQGSDGVDIYGNLTLGSGMTFTHSATKALRGTGSHTITFNGKTIAGTVTTLGAGTWTMQDAGVIGAALTIGTGTFDTNGQTLTVATLNNSGGSGTLTLGASTVTVTSNLDFTNGSAPTLNAGTSTINMSSSSALFRGNGRTFHNVSFTNTATPNVRSISGTNTFNNLTFERVGVWGAELSLEANQTINGTLSFPQPFAATERWLVRSNTIGTARTLTAAAVSLTDVDFRDVTGAGAATWSGTRVGDLKGNSGITFTTGVDKFWVGGTGNWNASNRWATSSNGATDANNFPLPQDTVVFDASSFSANGQTVTINISNVGIGNLLCSGTDQTFTLNFSQQPVFLGDVTLDSNASLTGTDVLFQGRTTQNITSAGKTWPANWQFTMGTTLKLSDNATLTGNINLSTTVTSGTLDLNGKTLTITGWYSNGSFGHSVTAAGGQINITGNNTNVFNANSPVTANDVVNVNFTYSGSTGTRTIHGGGHANLFMNVTAGSDTVIPQVGNCSNLNFTGFSGTMGVPTFALTIIGNLTLSPTMTVTSDSTAVGFAGPSSTITSNGVAFRRPITYNSSGSTLTLGDNITMSPDLWAFTLTQGIVDLNGKKLTVGKFLSNNANLREIRSSASGGKLTTMSTDAENVLDFDTATNLTVKPHSWTLEVAGNTTNPRQFRGGGKTWPAIAFSCDTPNSGLDFVGNNTFDSISVTTPPQTLRFTAGSTTTVNTWNVRGEPGKLVTIGSLTAASHTLVKRTVGRVVTDWLSISRSTVQPGTWYAGAHSVNGGNNSGWSFTDLTAAVLDRALKYLKRWSK